MRKGLCTLTAALTAGALFFASNVQAQANSSPYWSTEGNSNTDNASKLGTTNAIPLRLFTNNAERAYTSTDGKFGIGTSTPAQRFHVEGTLNQAIFVSTTTPGTTSGSGMIGSVKALPTGANNRLGYFLTGSRGGAQNGYNAAGMVGYSAGAWTAGSSHPAYLTFETTPSGSATRVERVRIESGGNVGIGTNNPSNKLHVIGRGRFSDGVTVEESGIYSNNTNGNGVEGYGNTSYGAGLYGNGYYGVIANGGAYGVSASGSSYGMYGQGGTYGVYGNGSSYGVFGTSTFIGTYGLGGTYGIVGVGDNYGVYGYSSGSGNYAGYFVGDIYVSGSYNPSDAKLKKNIENMTSALDILNKLNPKAYEFRNDGNYSLMNLPKGKHYGIMAQELEAVLPSLVADAKFDVGMAKHSKEAKPGAPGALKLQDQTKETIDYKAVNYTELIPVLVKAVQEQQQEIENLKDQLNKLTKGQGGSASLSNATMSQNSPNPVRGNTTIAYTLPNGTRNARMLVTDGLGRTIKSVVLSESGTLQLNTSTLSSGVYNYSLIIDNQTISTRKMTVVR